MSAIKYASESLGDFYRVNKPLIRGILLWGAVFTSLFFFDWSGETGWFLFGIIGMVLATVYLGFSIYNTVALHYVENRYINGEKQAKQVSYKRKLRQLRRQREKAAIKVYENRNYSITARDYEHKLASIERQIEQHMYGDER